MNKYVSRTMVPAQNTSFPPASVMSCRREAITSSENRCLESKIPPECIVTQFLQSFKGTTYYKFQKFTQKTLNNSFYLLYTVYAAFLGRLLSCVAVKEFLYGKHK